MSADTLFLERISMIKKLVLIKTLHRMILIALLIFLCLYTTATIIEKTGIFPFREYVSFYVISLALALMLSSIYVYATKKGFIHVLIDIDTRLQLKDRVSTAYEYHNYEKQSEFTGLLIEDAGHKLSELNDRQLFPLKLSLVHLLLSLLIVANILFVLADYFQIFPVSNQTKVDQETSKKISSLLQSYTKMEKEQKETKKEGQKTLHKKMEDLAKKLDEQEMTREELSKSVNTMLKEVRGTKTRLTKELDSKLLDLRNVENLPVRDIPQIRRLSSRDLRDLRERLNEMFDNQIPESLEYELDRLEEQQDLERMLEQIRDDIGSDTDDNEGSGSDEGQETAENESDSEEEGTGTDGTENDQDLSEVDRGEEEDGSSIGADFDRDQRYGRGEGMEDTDARSDQGDGNASPGHGRSDGTRQDPYELERSRNVIMQDKMTSAPRDDYNAHIRALTTIGNSTVPEEDITRPYQQEIEDILQKEDIPLNYREYIKNYFISIGLRKQS
jgi:hypothetical protein